MICSAHCPCSSRSKPFLSILFSSRFDTSRHLQTKFNLIFLSNDWQSSLLLTQALGLYLLPSGNHTTSTEIRNNQVHPDFKLKLCQITTVMAFTSLDILASAATQTVEIERSSIFSPTLLPSSPSSPPSEFALEEEQVTESQAVGIDPREWRLNTIKDEYVCGARRGEEDAHQAKDMDLNQEFRWLLTPPSPNPSPSRPAADSPLLHLLSKLARRQESLSRTETHLHELFARCDQKATQLTNLKSYHGAHLANNVTLHKEAIDLEQEHNHLQHELREAMKWRACKINKVEKVERKVRIEENRWLIESVMVECHRLRWALINGGGGWLDEID